MAVRLGFIGCGGIAQFHWGYLAKHPDVELTAFCDIVEEKHKAPAKKFGAAGFADYRDMVADAKLDAVYVCVPPYADGQIEIDCLEAALPIFVEKPIALDMATARKVEATIAKTGQVCSVGYHWRYMPATDLARELLGDEQIGLLDGRWIGGVPGVFWWPQMAMSGGQMTEQCTHLVDLSRYFGGEVKTVSAGGSKGINCKTVKDFDVWDAQASTLTFDSGLIATIRTSCLAHHHTDYGLSIFTPESKFEIGEIPYSSKLTITRLGQKQVHTGEDRKWKEARYIESDIFLKAVQTGDTSAIRCDYSEAVETLAVNLAISKATETGQTVAIADMG